LDLFSVVYWVGRTSIDLLEIGEGWMGLERIWELCDFYGLRNLRIYLGFKEFSYAIRILMSYLVGRL
jgi:hypothetical protein